MKGRIMRYEKTVSFCLVLLTTLLLSVSQSFAIGNLSPLPVEYFSVEGHDAFVIEAEHPADGKPWVWYAPTLKVLPSSNWHGWYFKQLLEAGISIGGIDLGEVRGSPASNEKFTLFYDEMVRRGFSRKPILLGQSRGGLMMLSWAMRNPDKLTAFAGIYPVCNLASWPLKSNKVFVLKDYGLSEEQLRSDIGLYNPIDNLQGLLQHNVPVFIIHGNADKVVPYEENSAILKERYEAGGGNVGVKIIDGQGHQISPEFFECRELLDFMIEQAKKGE